jgi:hypothetical protein
MGIRIEDLLPAMQDKLREFVSGCAEYPDLTDPWQVVITEGRRLDYVQAKYFCQGRTPSEIAAELDHHHADQKTRELMQLAINEVFGETVTPETRAPGRIITNAFPYSGPHCLGAAFHARVKHGARMLTDQETPWDRLGRVGHSAGLVWGGDWKMRDEEHFELPRALWPGQEPPKAA